MANTLWVSLAFFMMHMSGAKFEEQCDIPKTKKTILLYFEF